VSDDTGSRSWVRPRPPKRSVRVGFASAALALACGADPAKTEDFEVGVVAPFARTGLMAEAEQAWRLVVDDINDSGGVDGRTLDVHVRDTPLSDPADLSPVGQGFVHLAEQGYKYIISLVSGAAVEPIVEAAVPHRVLAMSITSEEPAEALPSHDGMLLRGILSTERVIQMQASALEAAGLRSMVILGETRRGAADPRQSAMERAYASCAACSSSTLTYPAEADLYRYDWADLGARVVAAQPDVIFLASANPAALVDAVFSIERSGYTGLYHFAYGALMAPVAEALAGSAAPPRFRSHDLALPPSDHLERFLASYQARYGETFVPEPRLIAFADYVALLSLAVSRVGDSDPHQVATTMREIAGPPGERFSTLDYAGAVEALAAGRDIDFDGLSGPLDFDDRGEVSDGYVEEYRVDEHGDIVPVP
jgi:branched-chain amino acid transport system substrate-binding protein